MGTSYRYSRWVRYATLPSVAYLTLACSPAVSPAAAQQSTSGLVLRGVTVIDVADGQLLPKQTVIVAGNRIESVGPVDRVKVPAGAQVIDANGQYLIPGLWDMHVHVDGADQLYPLFIANGVTGIREMAQGGSFGTDSFAAWQRKIAEGKRIGPRGVGPSTDLSEITNPTPEDAVRIIDSLKAAGIKFAKYHNDDGNGEIFFAFAREARRVGLPMVGHIPRAVSDVEASDSGLRSVEHVEENHQCWPDWPTPLDSAAAEKRCTPVAKAYIKNGTWMSTTVAGANWIDGNVSEAQRFVRMMYRLGVTRFLAGTDWNIASMTDQPRFRPGVSAVEDVMFLGEAIPPLVALQAGTLNPAQFFDATDSLGTVAPGKLADLVLLDADPLVDIHNIMKIRAVIANGRYFDRATLDRMDTEGLKLIKGYLDQQAASAPQKKASP
jgi:hypothetical protein